MNSLFVRALLALVALAAGVGGYYEYNRQTQEILHRQQLLQESTEKVKSLRTNAAALQTENAALTKDLTDAQQKVTELTSQMTVSKNAPNKAQSSLEQLKEATDETNAAADKAKKELDAVLHPTPPTNNFGTIVTQNENGLTYENCTLTKVENHDVVIHTSNGVVSLFYPFLPANLQTKFGYNPLKPGDLSDSQVNFQEKVRIEAGN